MNISQQDTYNLSWKIAGVLRGQLSPEVLQTYEHERLPTARALISVDKDMANVLTARANRDEAEVHRIYNRLRDFGAKGSYEPSLLVAKDGDGAKQDAATAMTLGFRCPDAKVFNQADGFPTSTQSLLTSNGLWRLLVFAGDVTDKTKLDAINAMGERLGVLQQEYHSASAGKKGFLEILLFHSSEVSAVESSDFHDTFFPEDKALGRNYSTLYGDFDGVATDEKAKGAHEDFGIDKTKGALVITRPDQVVAWVGTLDDLDAMEEWFSKFMVAKDDAKRRDSGRD